LGGLDRFHGQRLRRLLNQGEGTGTWAWAVGVVDERDPFDPGRSLLKQLQPFARDRIIPIGDPGDIGIAHGYATLGTIGYEGRFQYSVTGKVANLASRLCDEAKNGQILIDINVFSAIELRADIEFTEELVLKGFSRPVKAFNVRNLSVRLKTCGVIGIICVSKEAV
jgi:hypothetical protein